jgi:hypothetical protein
MTNRELAAEHARLAAEALAEAKQLDERRMKNQFVAAGKTAHATVATAHATLALYFQNEA